MLDSSQVKPNENIKYNLALLIDRSDSVGSNTLQQAKDAYISLIQSLIDVGIADEIRFGIIPFGSDASLETPKDATEAISTIEGLSGKGFTNFDAALKEANDFFSNAPSEARNIAYFLSDGYSTIGGSFEESAKALQEVAEVQAYGFGFADVQQLRIVDSGQPEIVPEASQLSTTFASTVGGLVASNEDVDSKQDSDKEVEVTSSPPENKAVQDKSSDTISQQELKKDEQNPVDDSVVSTPTTSLEPENKAVSAPTTSEGVEFDNLAKLGANLDASSDTELPVVNVEDISIKEGNDGSSIAQFTVNLSSPATEEISFSYQTIDGTAVSGSDYNQASGQITIPVGETSANIDVEVNGDTEVESNEQFTLNLKELSSATFENNQAEYSKIAVIENDDVVQSSTATSQSQDSNIQTADVDNILQGKVLNLESFDGEVNFDFTVDREASYDNTLRFYRINDLEGTITDPVTGNQLKPSDGQAYADLAVRLLEPEVELSTDESQSSTTIQDSLLGGYIYAPLMIA
ncbi:MAG: VWA domain-containing protein, partial [Rivularia sp. ALOHA_DT_140]|nr:VWA domain-containing protein [Rivularia sp. ALOHA_DT_140]